MRDWSNPCVARGLRDFFFGKKGELVPCSHTDNLKTLQVVKAGCKETVSGLWARYMQRVLLS